MSRENVEVVQGLAEAWRVSDRDAWMAAWDEDAEFYPLRSQLEGHGYHGRTGLLEFWAAWDHDWEWARFLVDEILDAGGQVVALAHFNALGKVSGVELDYPIGIVLTIRNGLVAYARFYSNAAEALEAAGLSE
jgi:ketosteroid isomerase-like protein